MRKKVSAMLEIVVCDDDIADLECAVTMLQIGRASCRERV